MKIPFLVNSNNKWLDISSNNKNMDYRYNMRKILGKESLKFPKNYDDIAKEYVIEQWRL